MGKKIALLISLFFGVEVGIAQTEIHLQDYFRTLKAVEVGINNKPYTFLFDTGGGITMVSPGVLEELQIPVYGSNVGYRMSGEKVEYKIAESLEIEIGGHSFFHKYVGVFDIMSLLPKEFKQIDGLISLKTFENSKISLDLNGNKIIIETEGSFKEKTERWEPVPARFATGLNGAEVNILLGLSENERLWWFLFDSGNIAQTKISPVTAGEWGLSYKENEVAGVGSYQYKIGNDTITVPTIIDDIIYDGALSFDFISQSTYFISFTEKKVWKDGVPPERN